MGYSTNFTGNFKLNQPATAEQVDYINRFSNSRRMCRDNDVLKKMFSGEFGLNGEYGQDGEYFANPGEDSGQDHDSSVINFNKPPKSQPGLWCQWVLSEDGSQLAWDGNEKFNKYIEWLKYMIKHFFAPWGIVLNGEVEWEGEDRSDTGVIVVTDNVVTTKKLA